MERIEERFLRYVAVDTQSKNEMDCVPSTEKQHNLAKMLCAELQAMGYEATHDEHAYVYATIPGNRPQAPVLGLIAHMDTSPDASGTDVKAQIVHYEGGDILLNKEKDIRLSPDEYEGLRKYVGQDIICTDGTTLLGADDKAGVAEIMQLAAYYAENPDAPHGTIKVGFTPDEEVGNGPAFFDVPGFGADFAYTLDGGEVGEIEYENFNASAMKVEVTGLSIHPGSAKDKMVNACLIAMEFNSLLPEQQKPAYTSGYEGFFHLCGMEGSIESATLTYIIRDHDADKFAAKEALAKAAADYINTKYGAGTLKLTIKESYRNMKEQIEPNFHLIENAKKAMESLGVTPITVPIRGGTDGATLSYMGLPCPNLCTGGANYHGRFEYISVQSMEKTFEIVKKIVEIYAEQD
jgi:tripeptide aminopeptidase